MGASERLLYIDRLKGIAIILVVCGHFIQYNVADFKHNDLYSFIYSFHMPLFMFISGYVAQKTTSIKIFENYAGFLGKKALGLLLPFFAWPLVVDRFFLVKEADFSFFETTTRLITSPQGGLWYLWFLFFLVLLHSVFLYFSTRFNYKNNLIFDAVIVSVMLGFLFSIKLLHVVNYIDSFILYYLFFYLGIIISKYDFFTRYILHKNTFTTSLLIFCLLVGKYEFDNQSSTNLGLKLVIAVAAIVSLYHMTRVFQFNQLIEKFVQFCGQNSIVIYTTHFTVIHLFADQYLLRDLNFLLLLIVTLTFSLIVIGFCFVVLKIVALSPFFNLVLYGNQKGLFSRKPENVTILSGTVIND